MSSRCLTLLFLAALGACAPMPIDDTGAVDDSDDPAALEDKDEIPTDAHFFASSYADSWKSGIISMAVAEERLGDAHYVYLWLTDGTHDGGHFLTYGTDPKTKQRFFRLTLSSGKEAGKFTYQVAGGKLAVTRLDPATPMQVKVAVAMEPVRGVDWVDHSLPRKLKVEPGATGELASLAITGGRPRGNGGTLFSYWDAQYDADNMLSRVGPTRCQARLVGDSTPYNVCAFRAKGDTLELDVIYAPNDHSTDATEREPLVLDGARRGLSRRIDRFSMRTTNQQILPIEHLAWRVGTSQDNPELGQYYCIEEHVTITTSNIAFQHGGASLTGEGVFRDVEDLVVKTLYYDRNGKEPTSDKWDPALCGPAPAAS